jgi:hypothetical protein
MPTARYSPSVAVVNGTVYVVGGSNIAGTTAFTSVEAYDPEQDKWTTVAPLLTGSVALNAANLNGILYACGGYSTGAVSTNEYYTIPVSTDPADGLTPSAAELNGSVKPVGSVASVSFEYGTTNAYGQITPSQPVLGVSEVEINSSLSGLTPSTTYHFRLVGNFDGVEIRGLDHSFVTPAAPNNSTLIAKYKAQIKKLSKQIKAAKKRGASATVKKLTKTLKKVRNLLAGL